MLTYPEIDPVAISIGPLQIHWYGIAYLCAFITANLLAKYQCRLAQAPIKVNQVDDLVFYGALGAILGGRIGYVLIYNISHFLQDPLWLFRIWEGGMSFHGGLIGVLVGIYLSARKFKVSFITLTDFTAPVVPIGLGLGRLANFVGQELWGRVTESPLGMVFPKDPLGLPRHPSQLYEAFLEGLVLFVILFTLSRRPQSRGLLSAVFLIGYGNLRFVAEFFREPDAHIQFDLFGWVSRGQILCALMVTAGLILLFWSQRNNH